MIIVHYHKRYENKKGYGTVINISKLLNNGETEHKEVIDTGKGIEEDLRYWEDKFLQFVKVSKPSKHTLRSYKFTLKALEDFFMHLKSSSGNKLNLSDFNIALINNFLSYIENYTINKEYGTLEERLGILFRFSDALVKCESINEFLMLSDKLADKFSIEDIETFHYMINDFAAFMRKAEVLPKHINNELIKDYIANISTLSNKTMQQRKAALQSFLTYIDKSTKTEHFKSMYWELKKYPLPKRNAKVIKCAFDEKLLERIVFVLNDYPQNIEKYWVKNYYKKDYIIYKNTLLILIMLYGGARASEVVYITYSDIELIYTDDEVKMYKITVLGKGNKERPLYIKEEHLKKHLDFLVRNRGKNEYISGKSGGETSLTTQALFTFAKKIFALAGSEKKGLHIFRHHFASNFIEKNGNIKLLQELLDHASVSTTMIYSDVREKVKLDALSQL